MLFAEAFSQALAAGVEVSTAVVAAADANPNPRFRDALHQMARHCRSGYSLELSLAKTRIRVADELLATLRVGEDRGCLPEELAAFARRCDPHAGARLAEAVGCGAEVTRFAAALARLLTDRPMTLQTIEDAGLLAAGRVSPFAEVIRGVVTAMTGGTPFPEALREQGGVFDPFFCLLIATPVERRQLRAVLERIGGNTGQSA